MLETSYATVSSSQSAKLLLRRMQQKAMGMQRGKLDLMENPKSNSKVGTDFPEGANSDMLEEAWTTMCCP
jgi:hypothetical protein